MESNQIMWLSGNSLPGGNMFPVQSSNYVYTEKPSSPQLNGHPTDFISNGINGVSQSRKGVFNKRGPKVTNWRITLACLPDCNATRMPLNIDNITPEFGRRSVLLPMSFTQAEFDAIIRRTFTGLANFNHYTFHIIAKNRNFIPIPVYIRTPQTIRQYLGKRYQGQIVIIPTQDSRSTLSSYKDTSIKIEYDDDDVAAECQAVERATCETITEFSEPLYSTSAKESTSEMSTLIDACDSENELEEMEEYNGFNDSHDSQIPKQLESSKDTDKINLHSSDEILVGICVTSQLTSCQGYHSAEDVQGFILTDETTTAQEIRSLMKSQLDTPPPSFKFLTKQGWPVASMQESLIKLHHLLNENSVIKIRPVIDLVERHESIEDDENTTVQPCVPASLSDCCSRKYVDDTVFQLKTYVDYKFAIQENDVGCRASTSTVTSQPANMNVSLPSHITKRADRIQGMSKVVRFLMSSLFSRDEAMTSTLTGRRHDGSFGHKFCENKIELIEEYVASRFVGTKMSMVRDVIGKRAREIQKRHRMKTCVSQC